MANGQISGLYKGGYLQKVEPKNKVDKDIPYVLKNGYRLLFSEMILFRSILKTGCHINEASEITELVKNEIKSKKEITTDEIFEITYYLIKTILGKKYAENYMMWHNYNELRRLSKVDPIIILVGGAPVVGKTITLTDLAYRLTISRAITTDAVRRILKVLMSDSKESSILYLPSFRVWKSIKIENNGIPPEVQGFIKQVDMLKEFINDLIRKSISDNKDIAIEGIHMAPWILDEDLKKNPAVIQVLISAPEKDLYKRMFITKHIREGSKKVDESLEQDFETCWRINNYLVEYAEKEKIPVIKFSSFDENLHKLLNVVIKHVKLIIRDHDEKI